MRKGTVISTVLVLVLAIAACGGGDVGDSCDAEGKADSECADGAVCGKDNAGALICLKQCTTQAECGAGEECNGISNTNLKGCRPKKP
jgi:hypothetical protein